jgi:hypothetical protein
MVTNLLASRATTLATLVIALASCGGSTTGSDTADGSTTTGGAGGSGGTDNTTCLNANVTFQMIPWHPEGGTPADYCAGAGCGGQWLSIKTAAGETLDRFFLCGVTCSDCSARPCAPMACMLPGHLPPEGATETWDGTHFASGTCGAAMQCSRAACVAAGSHLVATMCAYPNTGPDGGFGCMGSPTPNCVDVPFDFPSAAPVVGIINPTR